MILSHRFWRSLTCLVRLDMTMSIAITLGLLLWLMWH